MPEVTISDQPDAHRFVIEVDGRPIGLLDYRLDDGQIAFTHAEIDPASEGQGLGSQLAAYALDDARSRDLAVLPACPFVSDYIRRNPEYEGLVPEAVRPRYGL